MTSSRLDTQSLVSFEDPVWFMPLGTLVLRITEAGCVIRGSQKGQHARLCERKVDRPSIG